MANRITQKVKDNPTASALTALATVLAALLAVLAPVATTSVPKDNTKQVKALRTRIEHLEAIAGDVLRLEALMEAHAPGATVDNPKHR